MLGVVFYSVNFGDQNHKLKKFCSIEKIDPPPQNQVKKIFHPQSFLQSFESLKNGVIF